MDHRVLLVEDDERIRQALGLALGDEGFDVVEAASGEDALRRLDAATFDVVLLDLMLPGVDGLTVCQALRSRGDLRIIIVSAPYRHRRRHRRARGGRGRLRHQTPRRQRAGRADAGAAAPP